MQQRIDELARDAVMPLFFKETVGVAKPVLFGAVASPEDAKQVEKQP
jgi:hypothetical protein